MSVLASDFGGLAWLVLAFPLLLLAAAASYVPSARGHWSGPLLAAPLLLVALLVDVGLWADGAGLSAGNWLLTLSPLAIAAGSFVVWGLRLRARRRRQWVTSPYPVARRRDP